MRIQPRSTSIIVLFTAIILVALFSFSAQTFAVEKDTRPDAENLLLKRLLIAGCLGGLAVVFILTLTQIRGTGWKKARPTGGLSAGEATPPGAKSLRCRKCGRVFREELTAECTIVCPLCGHTWRWPPPLDLRLLGDRMSAFTLDPDRPRGDLTLATKLIARVSKGFAERVLIAGKYLKDAEMLCICENCREIHVTQKKNRGLLGICAGCRRVFLIW